MSGEEQQETTTFKIGIVGPTRVGKTSLITAIIEQGRQALAGTPATLRARGKTRGAIEQHREELEGAIAAGEFNAGALRGTEDRSVYELELSVGTQSLRLELQDFPGKWFSERTRPDDLGAVWEDCERFIKASSVLLVPIDAAVLMEAVLPSERQVVPSILRTPAVEQFASEWAKARKTARLEHREPGLMILAPLKCESYFADNGGRNDRAEDLYKAVKDYYHKPLDVVAAEAPDAHVLYAPVDTYGCVELKHATFKPSFSARYRFREVRPTIRPKGADTILGVICGQILEAAKEQQQGKVQGLGEEATAAQQRARSSGFFQSIKWFFSGEGTRRKKAAQEATTRHRQQQQVVEQLGDAVEVLAQCQPSGRSKWLRRKGGGG